MREADVVVIGAGAAGIAAARRLAAARVSVLLVEARSRLGGRAWTWREPSGLPLDLGCGWLHSADENEWAGIADELGFEIDRTPPPWYRPAHDLNFSKAEQEEFGAAWEALYERIDEAARLAPDRPAADLLEPGGRWNALLDALSSYINGVELDRLSVTDYSHYHDTRVNWRVPMGYGALIAAAAAGIDTVLDCPVSLIDHSGKRLRLVTRKGDIAARAAIVAVPPTMLTTGRLRFAPALPDKLEAAQVLPLGLADKVLLRVEAPDGLPLHTRLFGDPRRVASGSYHLRPFGRPLIEGYFGGACARELEADDGFAAFATEQLVNVFGSDFRKRLTPVTASAWGKDSWALGSYSYAQVGHSDARAVLAAPVDDRLFFAGEACSRNDYSTAHGALRTGVAAAGAVTAALRASAPMS